jgi:uroporphyrin-III C-methyltransferase/precorrin-2 dehydrogenase/sirohydrochlorin ferrochelatase
MAQEAIHRLMVLEARRGHRVVRLKGGDPFVFGRGGEEMAALEDAGVPYEIIPGVTSAIAAPALAGIPVTHRGLSSALLVVSGHAPESYEPVLASLGPGTATVVVLMGVARAADIARYLIARGWAASTPAAVMYAASSPQAAEWVGRLDSLPRCADARPPSPRRRVGAPGTIVIGAVVDVAAASARRRTA